LISVNAMTAISYDYRLVALAVVIAVCAACAALYLAGRMLSSIVDRRYSAQTVELQ